MGGAGSKPSPREARSRAAVPGHARVAILSALAATTGLAWLYLVRTAGGMTGAMAEAPMDMLRIRGWEFADFLLVFLMWAIMMVGMMVPSAIPMTLVYAAVVRKAVRQGTVVPPTLVFVSGYVAMWTLFSVAATLAQLGLDRAALLSPMLVTTSPAIGAGLLIAAGAYQLTPFKQACLRRCRSPAHFISGHWRHGAVHFPALESGPSRRVPNGRDPWRLLSGVLLVADGAAVRRRGHEPAVDRGHRGLRTSRENRPTPDVAGPDRRRRDDRYWPGPARNLAVTPTWQTRAMVSARRLRANRSRPGDSQHRDGDDAAGN